MKLEEIKDWKGIRKYLDINFSDTNRKYKQLIDYQQNLAGTKYQTETPLNMWNKSFNDTLKYLEEKHKKWKMKDQK